MGQALEATARGEATTVDASADGGVATGTIAGDLRKIALPLIDCWWLRSAEDADEIMVVSDPKALEKRLYNRNVRATAARLLKQKGFDA